MKKISIFLLTMSCMMIISIARADLAPTPDDPCYKKNQGDHCTTRQNEKGTCQQSCDDRKDDNGNVMYSRCSLYCEATKKEAPKN